MKKKFSAVFLQAVFSLLIVSIPMGSVHAASDYKLLRFGGQAVKWGAPEMGAGVSLTYALIEGEEIFSGVRNCPDTGGVEALLSRAGISQSELEDEVAAVFARWESVANVRFREVEDVSTADILIGSQLRPRGLGYADITEDIIREGKVGTISKGMVCLNPELRWTLASLADDEASEGARDHVLFDLQYTLTHEIGHLLGLDHPGARGALMSFSYDANVRELQAGDIAGAVALYGPAREILPQIAASLLPAIVNADVLRLAGGTENTLAEEGASNEAVAVLRPAVRLLAAPDAPAPGDTGNAENPAKDGVPASSLQPGL